MGTPWRGLQLFSTTSENPLGNIEKVIELVYYFIVKPIQAIPDGDTLWQMVTKWFESEIEEEEMERYGRIEDWDVSGVEDMSRMFCGCQYFFM